ncbi:peptidoglycan D,D-transpeptidase FtsI family protein [Gleimia hominis]|uniref:peptidoglycan D,D-transpeptidase FtsI family protein n=1 Tax=Gleimia hominis TaxID=595468 RepID=UPI000C801D06|nr:penicillin-binding protein 2 [Gleimia hominis]WIK65241.1 penicillin-binding protein 2 [Gleimia hominis]
MKLRQYVRSKPAPFWILTIFLVGLVAIALQLINLQIVRGPELAAQGQRIRLHTSTLEARRGDIVDASGSPLATSLETYHIAVNQRHVKEAKVLRKDKDGKMQVVGIGPAAVAQQLAPVLGMDEAELGGKLVGESTYQYLKKDVPTETWRAVRKLNLYGIEWEPSYQRVYPNGSTAASVIGSIDAQGEGNSGLELTQDEQLKGKPGMLENEYGPTGEVIPGGKSETKPAVNGKTLHTTLRADLQHSVEEILNKTVEKTGAEWGGVVITEVSSGKVLVLADSGNKEITTKPQTSRIVQSPIEPGSVGKILTFATALEQGKITPLTPIQVPYKYTTADGEEFIDSHEHEQYTRTTTGVLAESSNTGTVQIGQRVTDAERFETFKKMGLGQATDVPLPGESAGILRSPKDWDRRLRYTTMFGQGYSMTQLQQVSMMAAVGNGGVYLPPRLIDGWTDADGSYHPTEASKPRQAIDQKTSQMLTTMLESTLSDEEGTGHWFKVDGYNIAAKTGTAELFTNGSHSGIAGSIVGLVPAQKPSIAVSVVLYRPSTGKFATDTAGPLFHDVVVESVRSLGVPSSSDSPTLYPTKP